MENLLDKLKLILDSSSNIVFFGGAGVSTESGIPDFRSEIGLYGENVQCAYPPEVMLSLSFFRKHTAEFYQYYREKMIHLEAKPNGAHLALAHMEKMGKLKAVITQNIDGLHQKAGSRNVLELHGSIYRNHCMTCGEAYSINVILDIANKVPRCPKCGGSIKPDVVLYEESLDNEVVNKAIHYIDEADVLIIGGTSLAVYPAAGLINYYTKDKLILINKSQTAYDAKSDLVIRDSVGKVLTACISPLD